MSTQPTSRSRISPTEFFRQFERDPNLLPRLMREFPGATRAEALAMHYINSTSNVRLSSVADYARLLPGERERLLNPLGMPVLAPTPQGRALQSSMLGHEFAVEFMQALKTVDRQPEVRRNVCAIIEGNPRLREELGALRLSDIFIGGSATDTVQRQCDRVLRPGGAQVRLPPMQLR
jgi:hypothetical protein